MKEEMFIFEQIKGRGRFTQRYISTSLTDTQEADEVRRCIRDERESDILPLESCVVDIRVRLEAYSRMWPLNDRTFYTVHKQDG